MIGGRIHDRATAEAALAHADVVLAGKSFLLPPDFVADVRARKNLPRFRAADADVAYTDQPLP